MLLTILNMQLPLVDPVARFLIILMIILLIPILSDKIKIPHLLGMIIAGIVIGPHGFNILERDSSIILSGTAGLLYIMFLAGLEIDMSTFRKQVGKSTLLGLYGFFVPMILGTLAGLYILGFSFITSVLLASMFASHTLITYPIVSKLGITKNIAVNISVGSTLITNTLALLVLAVVVGKTDGVTDNNFWLRLSLSFAAFTFVILYLFPIIARWFLKRYKDSVSQYIFVLVMVFSGAILSQIAGIEAIIGAFMAGLALNRLIPNTSPLMNRIDFVGNAIFIPFFLIGVGMLIDYRAFTNPETLFVALIMTVVATAGKYFAAWLTQKNFKFSKDERMLIFGLTNAQAAATLAAVLIGYNIIIGQDENGEPVRLLSNSILDGSIIMVLVTCTIASIATQRSAQNIVLSNKTDEEPVKTREKILIPVSNPNTIDELVSLSTLIKSVNNRGGLLALNVIKSESADLRSSKDATEILDKAKIAAAAADIDLEVLLRVDENLVYGITNVIKEHRITDLILGLHVKSHFTDSFLGNLTDGILSRTNITTFVYNSFQPVSTIRRHLVVVPEKAEYEAGFSYWLARIWNVGLNSGAKICFYSSEETMRLIRDLQVDHPIDIAFNVFTDWNNFYEITEQIGKDDGLIIVMSRKTAISYRSAMAKMSSYINRYLKGRNFILVYPSQSVMSIDEGVDLTNPSLIAAIEKIDVIGKSIAGIFRRHTDRPPEEK